MMTGLARWPGVWFAGAAAVIAVLAALWLAIRHIEHAARREQREADRQAVASAQDRAAIADLERALAIERTRATMTENSNDALSTELTDARARAAAHDVRLRDAADQSGGGGADMPRVADTAAIAVGSDTDTVLSRDDTDICVENVVRLDNARRWYREQQEMTP